MKIEAVIEEQAHHFLVGLKTEGGGEKEAAKVIRKYLKGEQISAEEEHILRTQLVDTLKILGIGVPFVLIPGASIVMPILIKVAERHNIELMPSGFSNSQK